MNIYLARHGTTEWNKAHLLQGLTDIELDDTGLEMARQSGTRLAEMGIRFDHVFSSPLKRAYRTAQLICGIGNTGPKINSSVLPYPADIIRTDERLTELCFGEFEGRNIDEMIADEECVFRYFKIDPAGYDKAVSGMTQLSSGQEPPESLTALLARTTCFVKEVIEPLCFNSSLSFENKVLPDDCSGGSGNPTNTNILICGHGALNRALLMYFKGITDFSQFWGVGLQPNCGITRITCTPNESGSITYDVQNECMVLYDKDLNKRLTKLL